MRRRLAVAALVLGMITFVASSVSWAEKSHLAQAIEHIEAAIKEQGKPKYEAMLVVHLTEARQHAEASKKEKANPHLDAALKELNAAIVDVEAKHADAATKAAKEALTHLKAVK